MNFAKHPNAEWWDATWNPFVGCTNKCFYCYGRRFFRRNLVKCELCRAYLPHIHVKRQWEPKKITVPSRIFVCSVGDLFCDAGDMPSCSMTGWAMRFDEIQQGVKAGMQAAPWHQYVILTKSPQNIPPGWNDDVPNLWVGVSVTREHEQPDYKRAMTLLDRIHERRILCIEPMLGPPVVSYPLTEFSWIIIGGLTGKGKRERHSLDWVIRLVGDSQTTDVPIFLKRNLAPEVQMEYIMAHREYPPELEAVKGK